ncbi:SPOR domain-containing protein [Azospirillum sp. TSO22-1]|uniref:SPOR domain-containing protein n=1 Tax=Azospirillum sp. TSO22-1 TaxID=716789 RepID=UPI000D613540|nr:SPOR domain-containing protein [Azospirillum sp. TSO22-1]PWC55783.1 hypothetical protein TSO221_03460 [Azospirillum sp. TSO22-1]
MASFLLRSGLLLALVPTALAGCQTTSQQSAASGDVNARIAALESELAALRKEFADSKPAIDRLVQVEGDMRILVDRLSQMAEVDLSAKPAEPAPRPAAAPVQAPAPVAAPAGEPAPAAPAPPKHTPTAGPQVAATPKGGADGGDGFGVHLASYRSVSATQQGWNDLRRRHPQDLQDLLPAVYELDLGVRGRFYRLLAGPLPTAQAAKDICAQLRRHGAECGVTAYNGQPGELAWARGKQTTAGF